LAGILFQSPGKPKGLGPVISGATPSTAQLPAIAANANKTIAGTIHSGLFFIIFLSIYLLTLPTSLETTITSVFLKIVPKLKRKISARILVVL
jgi:hypothetical protein